MNFKKITGFAIFIFLAWFGASAFAETAETGKVPEAFFPDSTFNFSTVLEGSHVTHDFVIKNNGDGPLNVEKVKTS